MSIDFHWLRIDFITFSATMYFKTFEINEQSVIVQSCCCSGRVDQHWWALVNTDQHSPMNASKVPQSPHRLLKAAEPLEAFISSRNVTHYKKFNFASKPKFVNQVWPFNTPHPFNPPVLQSSNHPVILVWEGGMRVAIELINGLIK